MSAVLFKSSSGVAQGASLQLVSAAPTAPVQRDNRDIEIARLAGECDALRKQLLDAERRWETELDQARAEALQVATREFRQDDVGRVEVLAKALSAATASLDAQLTDTARRTAPRLARAALSRLVRVRHDDEDWLVRIIERRLDELSGQAVVGLHIAAAGISDDVIQQVRQRFPAKVDIAVDPGLPPGSVTIGLRLGEVEIDPAAGLQQLLAVFDEDLADD